MNNKFFKGRLEYETPELLANRRSATDSSCWHFLRNCGGVSLLLDIVSVSSLVQTDQLTFTNRRLYRTFSASHGCWGTNEWNWNTAVTVPKIMPPLCPAFLLLTLVLLLAITSTQTEKETRLCRELRTQCERNAKVDDVTAMRNSCHNCFLYCRLVGNDSKEKALADSEYCVNTCVSHDCIGLEAGSGMGVTDEFRCLVYSRRCMRDGSFKSRNNDFVKKSCGTCAEVCDLPFFEPHREYCEDQCLRRNFSCARKLETKYMKPRILHENFLPVSKAENSNPSDANNQTNTSDDSISATAPKDSNTTETSMTHNTPKNITSTPKSNDSNTPHSSSDNHIPTSTPNDSSTPENNKSSNTIDNLSPTPTQNKSTVPDNSSPTNTLDNVTPTAASNNQNMPKNSSVTPSHSSTPSVPNMLSNSSVTPSPSYTPNKSNAPASIPYTSPPSPTPSNSNTLKNGSVTPSPLTTSKESNTPRNISNTLIPSPVLTHSNTPSATFITLSSPTAPTESWTPSNTVTILTPSPAPSEWKTPSNTANTPSPSPAPRESSTPVYISNTPSPTAAPKISISPSSVSERPSQSPTPNESNAVGSSKPSNPSQTDSPGENNVLAEVLGSVLGASATIVGAIITVVWVRDNRNRNPRDPWSSIFSGAPI